MVEINSNGWNKLLESMDRIDTKKVDICIYVHVVVILNRDLRQRPKPNLEYNTNYNTSHPKIWVVFGNVSCTNMLNFKSMN